MKDINILFVDDEPCILTAIDRILCRELYGLYYAMDGVEALEYMSRIPIQILVTDLRMPNMDGLSLLRKVKELYPDTIRLAFSAYVQIGQILPCINSGEIFRFIIKPAEIQELKHVLQEATEYYLLRKDRASLVLELNEKNEKLLQALENQKEIEKQLRQLSIMDDVTDLYNRRFLAFSLEQQFEQCKNKGQDLSCLVIDLIHFKEINEKYGYSFGDTILKRIAAQLLKIMSSTDLGFRYGGARFILLLPNSGLAKALIIGKLLSDWCLKSPVLNTPDGASFNIRFGVASLIRNHPKTPDELILMAENSRQKTVPIT